MHSAKSQHSMDFAPSGPYGGLLAIGSWPPLMILLVMISLGNNSGVLHFVDTSLFDQQVGNGSNLSASHSTSPPSMKQLRSLLETIMLASSIQQRYEPRSTPSQRVQAMVKRFPFVVNSTDQSGGTLLHYAVNREVGYGLPATSQFFHRIFVCFLFF